MQTRKNKLMSFPLGKCAYCSIFCFIITLSQFQMKRVSRLFSEKAKWDGNPIRRLQGYIDNWFTGKNTSNKPHGQTKNVGNPGLQKFSTLSFSSSSSSSFSSESSAIRYPQGTTFTTRLGNGITVATDPSIGETFGFGIFLKSGISDEIIPGTASCLAKLALKRTRNRSDEIMLQDLSSLVGSIQTGVDRDYLLYNSVLAPESLETTMELLADAVKNLQLTQSDVDESLLSISFDAMKMREESLLLLPELTHITAFNGQGLGNSILSLQDDLKLSVSDVLDFHRKATDPSRILIVCAGADHDIVVNLTERYFGDMKEQSQGQGGSVGSGRRSQYVGGSDAFLDNGAQLDGVSLGLEAPCATRLDQLFGIALINQILGGGSSFSAGGPGKGMFTRLYKNVLNTHLWMESAHSQCYFYRDVSLFTLYGRCHFQNIPRMAEILAESLINVDHRLSQEEFSRAKNMMKSNMLMNIESRAVQIEDVGRQSLCYGKRLLAQDLNDRIDAVTTADITRSKELLLSRPLTLVTYGHTESPQASLDSISRFGLKIKKA